MLGYLSMDIICSKKRTVFWEQSLRKTVSFEEQIMSMDEYLNIFSQPNWGYCVYGPSVLKIGEYWIFPSFSWGILAHVMRLDQSRESKSIWWIRISNSNRTAWVEYNSGSNWESDFKSAKCIVWGWFEITSMITPELYDTRSYYKLIMSVTKCKKLPKSMVEKRQSQSMVNIPA